MSLVFFLLTANAFMSCGKKKEDGQGHATNPVLQTNEEWNLVISLSSSFVPWVGGMVVQRSWKRFAN